MPSKSEFNNFLESGNAGFFQIVFNFGNIGFGCTNFIRKFFLGHAKLNARIMYQSTNFKKIVSGF